MEVKEITYSQAKNFLLPRHYSGRIPSISKAFGCFINNKLKAVCTFGKPVSNALCVGVMGEEYSSQVYELNRLCRDSDLDIQLSQFVSKCLKKLNKLNWIIISYSDTAMNHHGYIYQACNFIYTGKTPARTDKYTEGNKHSRHYDKDVEEIYRKVRSAKHRYVYFCTNKKNKKKWKDLLKYDIMDYPKGKNDNYKLGDYLEPIIIKKGENIDQYK